MSSPDSAGKVNAYAVIWLIIPSARATRVVAGLVSAAVAPKAPKRIDLRSIMVALPPADDDGNHSADGNRVPLKMPLWRMRAPRQRHQRHVVRVPFADRFRTLALEGVFDRFGLADRYMQAKQHSRDGVRPSVKAQF